jgi:hypothetical protein
VVLPAAVLVDHREQIPEVREGTTGPQEAAAAAAVLAAVLLAVLLVQAPRVEAVVIMPLEVAELPARPELVKSALSAAAALVVAPLLPV